jgi:hypothetical protein
MRLCGVNETHHEMKSCRGKGTYIVFLFLKHDTADFDPSICESDLWSTKNPSNTRPGRRRWLVCVHCATLPALGDWGPSKSILAWLAISLTNT